ncbi:MULTISPECIES: LacI family DNA-binding transcriptional regulator [unclassified Streptomyces]|uniref:LacI family DNA-binding transcriptional regulator n=1 Tax=Streptomyces evansiae TaxID=3075535 RepID=A0ABU2R6N0_9ACTN|nr:MULTISPECIES: LacI family DNA-binding transcriptional regulator [unclassified Streptomyces]MDT0410925.1 LacI family DNA-binding transcriptional regulator [Streptomyces sp. DSM 41979]SCE11018.1 transcriptional regulator, LacI family [Streptomyces sp. DfronAA-171]
MAVRLIDVARRAGVSPSTVSYVLSGNRPISAETRRRVEESIAELGFRPHAGARSIRRQATNVVAMVLPMFADGQGGVQMQFVLSALRAARARGFNLLLLTAEDGVAEINNLVSSAMVDGVIVMEIQVDDPRLPVLGELQRPVVLIGTPDDREGLVHVDFDFAAAGAMCVRHLLDLGHRHIGLLGQPADTFARQAGYALRAREGVLGVLREHELREVWAPAQPNPAGVAEAIEELFGQDPDLSALVVYNEQALPFVLERLKQLGMRVPGDMSVLAICPDDQAEHLVPPVSDVALPSRELGRLAFERLAGLIGGEEQPVSTLLAPQLKRRGSTGPPRRGR